MKRGGPLQRRTPLRSYRELVRKAWERKPSAAPKAKRRTAVPKATKDAVMERAGGLCEIGLPGYCTRWAVDPSHRKASKAGGRHRGAKKRHDALSNILAACRACHDAITSADGDRLTEYRDTGLLLEEHQDPADVMVTSPALVHLYGGPVYLGDCGSVWPADLRPVETGDTGA